MAHEHYNEKDRTYTIPDGGDVIEHLTNALRVAKSTNTEILFDNVKRNMVLLIKPDQDLKIVISNYEKNQRLTPGSIGQGIPQVTSPPAQEKGL